ncbi:MAG: glycosyltransferase family 2 protein [Gammaproteobacteria bacterium]|nr:glycosyltransferase family 2 protein [Gammaproteobacteria bacterium]
MSLFLVMATYNGESFLREQLDSLVGQSVREWTLLIRDDGSHDATVAILDEYAGRDGRIRRVEDGLGGLGAVANFARLMEQARDRGASRLFLVDQDDVWMPGKIAGELALLEEGEGRFGAGTPLLVHSDMAVVDEFCRERSPSFMDYQMIRHEEQDPLCVLVVQNFVTGCTALLNRPLLELALPIPDGVPMHDWWLALVAVAAGRILYLPRATLCYRQHGANQVGASGVWRTAWRSLTGRGPGRGMMADFARSVHQAQLLVERLKKSGLYREGDPEHSLLRAYCELFGARLPWYRRVMGLRRLGVRRQHPIRQFRLYLQAALWGGRRRRLQGLSHRKPG